MRELMFSLDQKILDPSSSVAARMVEYGRQKELFIVLPTTQKTNNDLSPMVHVYGSGGSNKVARFFVMCRTARSLIARHKIQSVTTQDPFFMGLLGLRAAHKFKIPLEAQVHGDFFGSSCYSASIGGKLRNVVAKFVLKYADTIRTVGERVKQSLVTMGIPENKITVRPVTLNTSITEAPDVLVNSETFVWAGRMESEKNVTFLIDVFADVVKNKPQARLVLVGGGSEKEILQKMVDKLGLQNNVIFMPWVTSPARYIKNARALLLPSLTESYGAVAMEANVLGTPVIMSDVGVANYELKPGPKVTILPINNKDKWIEVILKV